MWVICVSSPLLSSPLLSSPLLSAPFLEKTLTVVLYFLLQSTLVTLHETCGDQCWVSFYHVPKNALCYYPGVDFHFLDPCLFLFGLHSHSHSQYNTNIIFSPWKKGRLFLGEKKMSN